MQVRRCESQEQLYCLFCGIYLKFMWSQVNLKSREVKLKCRELDYWSLDNWFSFGKLFDRDLGLVVEKESGCKYVQWSSSNLQDLDFPPHRQRSRGRVGWIGRLCEIGDGDLTRLEDPDRVAMYVGNCGWGRGWWSMWRKMQDYLKLSVATGIRKRGLG